MKKYTFGLIKGKNIAQQPHDLKIENGVEVFRCEFTASDLLDALKFSDKLFSCWSENASSLGEREPGMTYAKTSVREVE